MKKRLSKISVIFLLTLFMFSFEGCKRKTLSYKDQELEKIVVVGSQWYGHIPVWIGIEKGIFRRYGFDVEWRFIFDSMDRLEAISAGRAQFASVGEIAMLMAMAQGNTKFYWVGNQDNAPGFEGLVARKGIDSFEKLRGKSIGLPFGSSVDLTCRMLLKQNGLDPIKDNIKFYNLRANDIPAVFSAGSVDAALIWEPGFSLLVDVEGTTVLGKDDETEIYKKFRTMTGVDVLIISRPWVDENSSRAKKFLKSYFESLNWVKENRDQAVEIVQGKYIQQARSFIQKNMEKFIWYDLKAQKQVMSDEGIFPQVEYIVNILYEDLETIKEKPDFRKWVNLDILPFLNNR